MPLKTRPHAIQLTPRQHQLLKMIAQYQDNRCYSPTLNEMACALKLSRSTVFEHITELRKKDLLCASPNRARSLTLTSRARALLKEVHPRRQSNRDTIKSGIPLAGRVAAGIPLEVIEDNGTVSLKGCFGDRDDIFALEVSGQSMVGEDIRDGDYVICQRSAVAQNGQLVVAIVDDDQATLKRFYKEKSCVRLQPSNDAFEPIYSDHCRIEAIVIGLLRTSM